MKRVWQTVLLSLSSIGCVMAQSSTEVRVVTCPVYRDTDAGKKSGCWLADDHVTGIRYDVSQSPTKPDWNFEVLIEGRVSAKQDGACGGVTLDPVRVSVLEGSCPRHKLPAETYTGRVFVLPARNLIPLSVPRATPAPPYADTTFHLFFDFNKSFVIYQYSDYLLDQAVTWIRAAQPRRIVITGHADTQTQLVSGRKIAEHSDIARIRAETIKEALLRLGIDESRLVVKWQTNAQPIDAAAADGLSFQSRRRVDISAEM